MPIRIRVARFAGAALLFAASSTLAAQEPRAKTAGDPLASIPTLSTLVGRPSSELADVVERFSADQQSLNRRYDASD